MPHPRTVRLKTLCASAILWSAAVLPVSAQFIDCESMFALRTAMDGGLTDCDTATLPAAVPDCGGLTANDCARLRYDQPRLDSGNPTGWPMASGQIPAGPYTAKFLAKCVDGTNGCAGTLEEVRCMDGTRPLLYIDKAVNSAGVPVASNKWMFHTTGGGSGFRPERIWDIYRRGTADDDDGEMSTRSVVDPPTLDAKFNGLYNPDLSDNSFREYNRVKLDKCTFDRVAGDHQASVALDDPDFDPVTTFKADVRIFWHGLNFWVAALNFLTQTEGRDLNDDGVLDWEPDGDPDLPSIADAEVILFTPWSGGASGFSGQADRLSDVVTTAGVDLDGDGVIDLPGLNAASTKVRVVVDGFLAPSHEVITADALGHRLDVGVAGEDVYGDFFTCGSLAHPDCGAGALLSFVLPPDGDPFTNDDYGPQTYIPSHPDSRAANSRVGMGVHLDSSCVDFHDSDPNTDDDIAPCFDSVHTLFNHVETPFLIRHSLRDVAHVNSQPGAAHTRLTDPPNRRWEWGASGHKRWARFQFSDVLDFFASKSHQVSYGTVAASVERDPACILTGATSPHCWQTAAFTPDQAGAGSHNGTEDDKQALLVHLVQCVDLDGDPLTGLEHAHRTLNTEEAVMNFIDGTTLGPIDAIEGRSGTLAGSFVVGGVAGTVLDYTWFDQCSAAADVVNLGCVDVAALTVAGVCP